MDQLAPLIDGSARRTEPASSTGASDELDGEEGAAEETPPETASADDASDDGTLDAAGQEVETFELGVMRDGDTLVLNLPVDPPAFGELDAAVVDGGLVWDDPGRGFRLDDVRPGTAAAQAGLRPGDRLLRIDGAVPDTLDVVRDVLAADRDSPVLLELERGARRTAILLP